MLVNMHVMPPKGALPSRTATGNASCQFFFWPRCAEDDAQLSELRIAMAEAMEPEQIGQQLEVLRLQTAAALALEP